MAPNPEPRQPKAIAQPPMAAPAWTFHALSLTRWRLWLREVRQLMGLPGVLMGVLLVVSMLVAIWVLFWIRHRIREDREVFASKVLEEWSESSRDYAGRTLADWVEQYVERGGQVEQQKVQALLASLGSDMIEVHSRFPWIRIAYVAVRDLRKEAAPHALIADWRNPEGDSGASSVRVPLSWQGDEVGAEMEVRYRLHPDLKALLGRLEYYSAMTLALIAGLGVIMVLCFLGLVLHFRRLRRRAQAEAEELQRADRLKLLGMLTYGLAHNLNNALAPIAGICHATLLQLDEASPLRSGLEIVERNVSRAADIVDRLRNLSRVGERRFVAIDLNAILDESLESVRKDLEQAQIVVERRFNKVPPVEGNPVDLWQLFTNLLVNAREAIEKVSPRRGLIRVVTYAHNGTVVAEIRDNGVGMTEEVRTRIGQPWFSTKANNQASGIGLWVCARIVQEHGGSWQVESTQGTGTTLRLRLPVSETARD
ncbi:MAG: HAMP domain-containing histidine kinase [Planctomycetes bacterium]|nr:HAMP domain-containing histidine kinase [Planctomycetota bacterium]